MFTVVFVNDNTDRAFELFPGVNHDKVFGLYVIFGYSLMISGPSAFKSVLSALASCYCLSSPLCWYGHLCDKGDAGSVCKLVPSLLKSLLHHLPLDSGCSRLNSLLSLPDDDSQVPLLTFQLHFTYPNSSHRTTPSIPFISLFWQSFISNANQSSSRRSPAPWCSAAGMDGLVSWGSTAMNRGESLIFLFFLIHASS